MDGKKAHYPSKNEAAQTVSYEKNQRDKKIKVCL